MAAPAPQPPVPSAMPPYGSRRVSWRPLLEEGGASQRSSRTSAAGPHFGGTKRRQGPLPRGVSERGVVVVAKRDRTVLCYFAAPFVFGAFARDRTAQNASVDRIVTLGVLRRALPQPQRCRLCGRSGRAGSHSCDARFWLLPN